MLFTFHSNTAAQVAPRHQRMHGGKFGKEGPSPLKHAVVPVIYGELHFERRGRPKSFLRE